MTTQELNHVRKIIENIRLDYYEKGARANGSCWLISNHIVEVLKSKDYKAKVIGGIFYDYSHYWVELDGMILDATGSQFSEITEDVLITTYEQHPQYRKFT